jgi:hypothetical protein
VVPAGQRPVARRSWSPTHPWQDARGVWGFPGWGAKKEKDVPFPTLHAQNALWCSTTSTKALSVKHATSRETANSISPVR